MTGSAAGFGVVRWVGVARGEGAGDPVGWDGTVTATAHSVVG